MRTITSLMMTVLLAGAAYAQSAQSNDPQLSKRAKISMHEAQRIALAKEPGAIKSEELEKENGSIIYSFDIATSRGIREVNVDAISGKVVEDSPESPASESREKKQDQQDKKQQLPPDAHMKPVPLALMETGEYAENIYDGARAGNWATAAQKLSALRQSTGKLRVATGSEMPEIEAALERLAQSIPAKQKIATARDSNLITKLAADLSNKYRRPVPVEVTLLDYYGRELQIGAETNNSASLKHTAHDIQQTWGKLRANVEKRSPAEATSFGQLVAKIKSTTSTGEYAKLASAELEQVDRLEKVFERSSAKK